jgi:plastocyanin
MIGGVLASCGGDSSQPDTEAASDTGAATFEYVIPVGAGEALDAGTPLEILPAELEANVGDTIRIENQDDRGHTVGPFFVGANETLTQRFSTPGEFEGVCTVHPSGQLVLIVNA